MNKRPYKTYSFLVKEEDVRLFESNLFELITLAYKKGKIAPESIRKVTELVSLPDSVEGRMLDASIEEISKSAYEYFHKLKGYEFSGTREMAMLDSQYRQLGYLLGWKKSIIDTDIRDICTFALTSYKKNHSDTRDKGVSIRILYKYLYHYLESFSPSLVSEMTHYKATVISTFLANDLELFEAKIDPVTNPKLYNRGKGHTDILKK